MSVTLRLDDDLDISRGDMICRPHNRPAVAQDIEAHGLLDERRPRRLPLAQADRQAHHPYRQGIVTDLHYRIDVNTLHRDESADPARPERDRPDPAALTQPIFADPYHATGRPVASS